MSLRAALSHLPKRSVKRTSSSSSTAWRRKISSGDFCHSILTASMASGSSTMSMMLACTCEAKRACSGEVFSSVMVVMGSLGFHLGVLDDLRIVAALFGQPCGQFGGGAGRRGREAQVLQRLLRLGRGEDLRHLGVQLHPDLGRHA